MAQPERVQRDVVIIWNRNAGSRPKWPPRQLLVADNRNSFAVAWDRFPVSLKADVDAWLDRLAGKDPTAEWDFRPLRPASLRTRRKQMHLFLSALVLRGLDPADLRTFADVVLPARAAEGLRWFWERAGKTAVAPRFPDRGRAALGGPPLGGRQHAGDR